MKREPWRNGGYRGRATATDVLRTIAIVLAVVVALVLAGLYFGQSYIVYTDEGMRIDLPFLNKDESKKPDSGDEIKVVVEPSQSSAGEEPVEVPENSQFWLRAVELPLDLLASGQTPAINGANAVVVDLKNDQGKLGYASQQPLAYQLGVNGQQAVNESLKALSETDVYVIARISCFRDHALAEEQFYAIETNPGRRWYDDDGVRWSSPANQVVQDYLIGILNEVAQLGVDEIVLRHSAYPQSIHGVLSYIKKGDAYPVGSLDSVITPFIQRAQQTLEESGVKLSLEAPSAVFKGNDTESGHTLALYAQLSGHIWLEEGVNAALAGTALEDAGMQDASSHLVERVEQLNPEEEKNQFIGTNLI